MQHVSRPLALTLSLSVASLASLAGCGSSSDAPADEGAPLSDAGDGGAEASRDAAPREAAVDAPFEVAEHAVPSEMPAHKGHVLAHPKIVPIYFANDDAADVAEIEAFHDALVGSAWWTAVTDGFAIGPLSHPTSLELPDTAPATMNDDGVLAAVVDHVVDGTLPYPDEDTLYSVFLPSGTVLKSAAGQSCVSYGGFHTEGRIAQDGGFVRFAYAVLPRCSSDLTELTVSASHEYIEAATDPLPYSKPGYSFDQGDPWSANLGEVADVCNGYDTMLDRWTVTRSWSIAAARADRDPCQPSDDTLTYFNAAISPESQTIEAGQSGEFELHVFSTKPMAQPIDLRASTGFVQHVPLGLKLDKSSARNGDVVKLTVSVPADTQSGSYAFQVDASRGSGNKHFWGGAVVVP